MTPGWVRISQLHMKAEWPWDGRMREGIPDCADDEGSELGCFDRTAGALTDQYAVDEHAYRIMLN